MTKRRGRCVVMWLEDWGERFLKPSQPYVYEQLLLHVGATDTLRHYHGTSAYWQSVQTILDNFFTAAQRGEMCAELIDEPLFRGRGDFWPFLAQAKAEFRVCELIAAVEVSVEIDATVRSIG